MNPIFKINAQGKLEANPEEVRKNLQNDPRFAHMLKETSLSKTIGELLSTEMSHQKSISELYENIKTKRAALEKAIGKEKTNSLLTSLNHAVAGSKLAVQAIEQNLFLYGKPIDTSNTSKEEISLRLGKCLGLIAHSTKFLKDGIQFMADFGSDNKDIEKIQKIAGTTPEAISSTIIRIVQRGPRYELLSKELVRNLEKAKYDNPDPISVLNQILSKKSPADAHKLATADANTALGYLAILKRTELKDLKKPAHFSNTDAPLTGHVKAMAELGKVLVANNESPRTIENERKNAKEITKFIKEQKPEITAKKVPQDINLNKLSALLAVQIKAKEPKLNHLSVKVKSNHEISLTTLEGNELIKITQKGRDIKFELGTPKANSSKLDVQATLEALKTASQTLHTAMLTQKLEQTPEYIVRGAQKKATPAITDLYNTTAKWQERLSQKHKEDQKNAHKDTVPSLTKRLQAAQTENSISGHRGISTTQQPQAEDSISQRSRSNSFLSFTKPAQTEQIKGQDPAVADIQSKLTKDLKDFIQIIKEYKAQAKGIDKAKNLIAKIKDAKDIKQLEQSVDATLTEIGNKQPGRFYSTSTEFRLKSLLEAKKQEYFSPEVKEKPKLK